MNIEIQKHSTIIYIAAVKLLQVSWCDIILLIKMKRALVLPFLIIVGLVQAKQLTGTITKVSGSHAPKNFQAGDLIFEENFDTLDLSKWQHENTLGGGGVSNFRHRYIFNSPFISL